jgi:glycosyltransferase involved in cell wall biosynthesis
MEANPTPLCSGCIIAINSIIVDELKKKFPISHTKYLVEPNGVDASDFMQLDKAEARTKLGLPVEKKIALYAGRFFDWKGLEILPKAAELTPHIEWYLVGGDEKHFAQFVKEPLPANIHFAGSRPHQEMPLWLAAADALVVLGTKRDTQSYFYTSPMKLFEYLLAGRPIVASNTPAIAEIVSAKEVLLYEPDNAQDMAEKIAYAVLHNADVQERVSAAEKRGSHCTWEARAKRIKAFMME